MLKGGCYLRALRCCSDPAQLANMSKLKVSATLKIAIFPYLRFQRFQINMLESFLLKKKIRRKYYFCPKISGVKEFFSLIIFIDRRQDLSYPCHISINLLMN